MYIDCTQMTSHRLSATSATVRTQCFLYGEESGLESIQSLSSIQRAALTFAACPELISVSLGSFVVGDAPHHPSLVPGHLGLGCGVRLGRLPRLDDFFLGLYDLFLGLFRGFGCRGLFVGCFYGLLAFLIIGVL